MSSLVRKQVAELVRDANGAKKDATFLANFLTRPPYPAPPNVYDQFLPIPEFKQLMATDPVKATRRYWYEIDVRLEHLRSSSHKLLRYYARRLLDTYKEPVASAPLLRSALETTAKAVGYNWAAVTAFNSIQDFKAIPERTVVISTELENLFLSYSHASKTDLLPLILSKAQGVSLSDVIPLRKPPQKQKTPTVAKLLGICSFLNIRFGGTMKYIYSIACDITHAGSVCLALSDLIADPLTDSRKQPGIYRDYAQALGDAYPILCLEGLKCSFALFRKYILDPAPVWRFLPLIERLSAPDAGPIKEMRDITFQHIKPFLNGDQHLVWETAKGKVQVYP
jgi:hypothetical protein